MAKVERRARRGHRRRGLRPDGGSHRQGLPRLDAAGDARDALDPEHAQTPSGVTVTPVTPASGTGSTRTGGASSTTVALTKHAAKATVVAGREVVFTIRLRNTGKSNLLNLRVCDVLPGTMTFVSAPGATFSKGQACWSRPTLRPASSWRSRSRRAST